MLQILLLLLLFVVLYPLVRMWLVMRRVRRTMRDAMRAAEAEADPTRPQRYSDDQGEYADFRDLPTGDDAEPEAAPEPTTEASTVSAPTIIDADFEEIE